MDTNIIYTVGHSNLSFDNFYKILKNWNIDCLVDIRSAPYSRYTPHFNKENLADLLKKNKIIYLHFKDEFGARPESAKMYSKEGIVDFKKMRDRMEFKKGIERLEEGIVKKYQIILMCSCTYPLLCHRFIMISKYLTEERELIVKHIFPYNKNKFNLLKDEKESFTIEETDKTIKYYIKNHQELEKFDKEKYSSNLFYSLDEIYFQKKNQQIGYKLKL